MKETEDTPDIRDANDFTCFFLTELGFALLMVAFVLVASAYVTEHLL